MPWLWLADGLACEARPDPQAKKSGLGPGRVKYAAIVAARIAGLFYTASS
jgi:hypothetical protein